VFLRGDGGSIASNGPIGSIVSTGALGTIYINFGGLGSITAPSIIGDIIVKNGAITGIIQTTGIRIDPITGAETAVNAELGRTMIVRGKVVTTQIFAKGLSGQIVSRGDLISTIKIGGSFTGAIAAQGNIGALKLDAGGNAVATSAGKLTRYGGIAVAGDASGQIISLGNLLADVTVKQAFSGRIAVKGEAISGLAAARFGILGAIKARSFTAGAAVISGGLIGDAGSKTAFKCAAASGFVASNGALNLLKLLKLSPANIVTNALGTANGLVLDGLFTNGALPLGLDIVAGGGGGSAAGDLGGLTLIGIDLGAISLNGGNLSGTLP
jgi:hypothetical protein